MSQKKAFILIPDGVGLRNVVFSEVPEFLQKNDFDVAYWDATPFNFKQDGRKSVPLAGKPNPKTDLLKRARKIIEINNSFQRTGNENYKSYLFKPTNKTFKQKVKNILESILVKKYRNRLELLRKKLRKSEIETNYFQTCLAQLKIERPDVLLVSNQRPINAVAPVEAAKKLSIPTACFIFSWDNLPKATMVVETDYYLVWSVLMKNQLLEYYPYVNAENIFVVGTPQFEIHFKENSIISKQDFFKTYDLDLNKEYICFSGDDVTTSPHDQEYLRDIAEAVRTINKNRTLEKAIGIIFRPCPVDFTSRFDKVLIEFKEEIKMIRPAWKKHNDSWNSVMPSLEDQVLLASTVAHTKLVVNVGSSMVFDYVSQDKPCMFINYNPRGIKLQKDIHLIYQYIHFQSMPNNEAVVWFDSEGEIIEKLLEGLNNPMPYVENAQKWFGIINQQPPQEASKRIAEALNEIAYDKKNTF